VDTTTIVTETLERSLEALHEFPCPSHHREQYERTKATLQYLCDSDAADRVVFVERPTFAPLCADIVPDSGVCFLRQATRGPKDLASEIEQGALSGAGLFLHLWADALGVEYTAWRQLADRAPAIFVRLGESICSACGRWQWAPLPGPHRAITYPDVSAAFAALIRHAQQVGDAERADRLSHWQYGVCH
jgi:hypothetical protein